MAELNLKFLPKVTENDYQIAKRFLDEKVIDNKKFGDVYIGENIWSCGPQENRMWLWTLHAFLPIDCLLAVGKYKDARGVIDSWVQQYSDVDRTTGFPWHDHATALRLDRLSIVQLKDSTCDYSEVAALHANLLMQDDFYSKDTNHGFDQSLSLILASFAFHNCKDSSDWLRVGLSRLRSELDFAFTSEGVHVENSPAYHFGMISNLLRAKNILEHIDSKGLDFDSLINKAILFLVWITRPDRFLAYMGDSASYRPSVPAALLGMENVKYLDWVASGGIRGMLPAGKFKVYSESGYAIYRSAWHDWPGHTHLIMKCGFLSKYHRQDDDLNIVLHAYGEDWLIDSGLYNHNQKDPVRIYMRSGYAHNIPFFPGRKISRSQTGKEVSSLLECDPCDYAFAVEGISKMHNGVTVRRKLFIRNEREFRVLDRFKGGEGENRYWMFHFPLNKKIKYGGGKAVISGRGMDLVIRANVAGLTANVYKGMNGDFPSVLSKVLNKFEDSQVLVFGPSTADQIVFSLNFASRE